MECLSADLSDYNRWSIGWGNLIIISDYQLRNLNRFPTLLISFLFLATSLKACCSLFNPVKCCPCVADYAEPYVIGLLPRYVEIRTISPRALIQSIELPKPRFITQGKHMYVASTSHVWRLIPVSIPMQIQQLLQDKQFSLALMLAVSHTGQQVVSPVLSAVLSLLMRCACDNGPQSNGTPLVLPYHTLLHECDS